MAILVADWSDFHLTDAGLRMRQKAIAEQLSIRYTRAAIGEGIPAVESDIWTLNALISFRADVHVKKSYALDTTHHLLIKIDNKDMADEILMREIGVHAQLVGKNGNLIDGEILYGYSYTKHGYDPIPAGAMQKRTWTISANTGISRTSDVTILCDDTLDMVSREELEQRLSEMETNCALVRIEHGLGCYPLVTLGALQNGMGMRGYGEAPCGGSDMEEFPAKAVYHSRDALTVRTVKRITDLGMPELHRMSRNQFTVTFEGNDTDCVYIQLTTDAYRDPAPPEITEIIKTGLQTRRG